MAKFFGIIGFAETKETAPGVWTEEISEREYYGDVLSLNRKLETGEHLNDDININNRISILADPFAFERFSSIRYVSWMGAKWKVSNVEVQYPRLILSIGGVYNET